MALDRNIFYKVVFDGIDTSELKFAELVRLAKELKSELSNLPKVGSDEFKNLDKDIRNATKGVTDLAKAIELANTRAEQLQKTLQETATNINQSFTRNSGLAKLQEELRKTQEELKKLQSSVSTGNSSKSVQQLTDRVRQLEAALASANKTGSRPIIDDDVIKNLRNQIKFLTNELLKFQQAGDIAGAQGVNRQIEDLRRQLEAAQQVARRGLFEPGSLQDMRLRLRQIDRELDNLTQGSDAFEKLSRSAAELRDQIRQAEVASGRFQRNIGNYPSLGDRLVNVFKRIGVAVAAAWAVEEVIFRVRDAINTVLETTIEFSGEITKATSIAQRSVQDLENTVNTLGISIDLPVDDVTAFSEQLDIAQAKAREIAATSAFTATEISQSFTQLARSGFTLGQIYTITPQAQQFALAAGEDIVKSTDTIIGAIRTYSETADFAQEVTNTFASTLLNANVDLEQFSEAFKQLAPTAASLNIDIQEVSATIGVLGDRNLRGTLATTSLKTALTRLVGDIPAVRREISRLGLQLEDSNGQFVGIIDTVRQLEEAYANFSPAARAASLSVLVGNRAFNQFSVLIEEGADNLDRFAGGLRTSALNVGLLLAQANKLGQNLDNVQANLSSFGIEVQIDENGVKNYGEVIQRIRDIAGELSQEDRVDLITTIFGEENFDVINNAINATEQEFQGFKEALQDMGEVGKSAVDNIASKQLQSLPNQIKLAQSAVEELALTLGDIIEDPFRDLISGARLFTTALAETIRGTTDVNNLESFQNAKLQGLFTQEDLDTINQGIQTFRTLGQSLQTIIDLVKILGPLYVSWRINGLLKANIEAGRFVQTGERLTRTQNALLSVGTALTRVQTAMGAGFRALIAPVRNAATAFARYQRAVAVSNAVSGRTPGILGRVGTSFGAVGSGLLAFVGTPLRAATNGFRALFGVLRANPIGLIITAVQFLLKIFKEVGSRNDEVGRTFRKLFAIVNELVNLVGTVAVAAVQSFVKVWLSAADIVTGKWEQSLTRLRTLGDDWAEVGDQFIRVTQAGTRQAGQEIIDELNNAAGAVTVEEIKKVFLARVKAEGLDLKKLTKEQFQGIGQIVSDQINAEFRDAATAAGQTLATSGILQDLPEFGDQFNDELDKLGTDLGTRIRLVFDELYSETAAANKDGLENLDLTDGDRLDKAIRQLELQADKILQRLETVGDRANNRLKDAFIKNLREQEGFIELSLERQAALIQDGLNQISAARIKALETDLEYEQRDLEKSLDTFSKNIDERIAVKATEYAREREEVRRAFELQLIDQQEFNDRLLELETTYTQDVAAIRRSRLTELLDELISGADEFENIANPIRQALEQQAQALEDGYNQEIAVIQQARSDAFRVINALQEDRLAIEERYTQALIENEERRTAALVQAATSILGAQDTSALQQVFDAREQQAQEVFDRERQALLNRSAFIESTLRDITDRYTEEERRLNVELQALAQERVELEAELSNTGVDQDAIRARIAVVDDRIAIIQDLAIAERNAITQQNQQLTEELQVIYDQRLKFESDFTDVLIQVRQERNAALLAVSTVGLDTNTLADQFVARADIIREGFNTEIGAVDQLSERLANQLVTFQRRRETLEKQLTQQLRDLEQERRRAISEVDINVQGANALAALEESFANRRAVIEASFESDTRLILKNIGDTENRLQAALDRRSELDSQYFNTIIEAQSAFNTQLLSLQKQAANDLSQEVLLEIDGIVSSYQQQAAALRAGLEAVVDSEDSSFADRLAARQSFVNNLQSLIAQETQALSDFAQQNGVNFDTQPLVDLFQERLTILDRNFQSELNLLEARRTEINSLVQDINNERVATEQRYQDQLDGLAQVRRDLVARFSVDGDLNLQNVGTGGPSPTDVPPFLQDDTLALIEQLIEDRNILIGRGRDREIRLIQQKQELLLEAQKDINDAGIALEQDYTRILSQLGQEQIQVLGSAVGVTVDLTDLRTVLQERQQITEDAFQQERQAFNNQIQQTRSQLTQFIDERIRLQQELNQRLAASNTQLQITIADAVKQGAPDSTLDAIRQQFAQEDALLREQYNARSLLIAQNESRVRALYEQLLNAREAIERKFFADSADTFRLGNALVTQAIAGSLAGVEDTLVEQTVRIQEKFNAQLETVRTQLSRVNAALTDKYAERVTIETQFNKDLDELLRRQDNLLQQATTRGDTAQQLDQLRATFSRQESELRQSFSRRLVATDGAIRDLSARLAKFTEQQSSITEDFAQQFQRQNEAFVRNLIANLEGQDLLDALTNILTAELNALDDTFALQNRALEGQIEDQINLQLRLSEESIRIAQERSDRLADIERERNDLIAQLQAQELLPDSEPVDVGNIVQIVGKIPGAEEFARQFEELQRQAEETQRVYEAASNAIVADQQKTAVELEAARRQQNAAYEDYVNEVQRLTQEQVALLDDLVDREILSPEVRAAEAEALRVRNLLAEVRDIERQENAARLAENQVQAQLLSQQLQQKRFELQEGLAALENDWFSSLSLDYEKALELASQLSAQYLESQRLLRERSLQEAEDNFVRTNERLLELINDPKVIQDLLKQAQEIGGNALANFSFTGLTQDQLNALSQSLDQYREAIRSANDAFDKAAENSVKRTTENLNTILERVQADLEEKLAQSEEAILARQFNLRLQIEQDYLNAVERNRASNEELENRRRLRLLVAERAKAVELAALDRQRIEGLLKITGQSQAAINELERSLAQLDRQFATDQASFFEQIREEANKLTNQELKKLREELVALLRAMGKTDEADKLEETLKGNLDNLSNTFKEVEKIAVATQDYLREVSNIVNDVFQIDEGVEDSRKKIGELEKSLEDLDNKYLEQIDILERLAGIQRDGLSVADARNVAQRLAAFGIQQALEDEANALRTRYEMEKEFLDSKLEAERKRNEQYIKMSLRLKKVEVATATAIATAKAAQAVIAAAAEGTPVNAIIAAATIAAAVGTLIAGIQSIIKEGATAGTAGETGGQPIFFQPLFQESGGGISMMETGGPSRFQSTRTQMRRGRWGRQRTYALRRKRRLEKVPRGRKLPGRSHKRGGILTELEKDEFVMSVPSVKMFLPQLAWMNEQGNRRRAGQAYSTEFPSELFPQGAHSPNPNFTQGIRPPKLVTPVLRGFGASGGLAIPNDITGNFMFDTGDMEEKLAIMTDAILANSDNIRAMRQALEAKQFNVSAYNIDEAKRRRDNILNRANQ